MPKVTQLAVTLANKAGALAQLCSTLGKAGVNVSAFVAPEVAGRGRVRLLVNNPDKAKEALNAAKLRFSEGEVVVMELENKPNALGEVAEKLAQAKISIKYACATVTEGSAKGTVLLSVRDVARALTVLGG